MPTIFELLIPISVSLILFSCGRRQDPAPESTASYETTLTDASVKTIDTPSNVPSGCGYDNQVSSLGIGLVVAPSKFEIYNDSLLTDRRASLDMFQDEGKMALCSKFFKPDYGIMHFVCIGKTDKAYKVLINYSDLCFLPVEEGYAYKTWSEYILQSFGIRRLTSGGGNSFSGFPLRSRPTDAADTLTIPRGHEMFCPIEIKGDWVMVKYDCFYNNENGTNEGETCQDYINKCKDPLKGWLRWRQNNKLLIDIFLMP